MGTEQTTDIALRGQGNLGVYEPANVDQAMRVATMISQSGLLGKKVVAKPETVFYLMATGHELGFSVAQSLRAFDIIEGVPCLRAQAKVALVRNRREVCEYFRLVEQDDLHATWATKRVGDPESTFTYSIGDARQAGLIQTEEEKEAAYQEKLARAKANGWDTPSRPQPGAWDKDSKTMLMWRCATKLIDRTYSDVILGIRSSDEAAEIAATTTGRTYDVTPGGEVIGETEVEVARRARGVQHDQEMEEVRKKGTMNQMGARLDAEAEAKQVIDQPPASEPAAAAAEAVQEAPAAAPAPELPLDPPAAADEADSPPDPDAAEREAMEAAGKVETRPVDEIPKPKKGAKSSISKDARCPLDDASTIAYVKEDGGLYRHCINRRIFKGQVEGCKWMFETFPVEVGA